MIPREFFCALLCGGDVGGCGVTWGAVAAKHPHFCGKTGTNLLCERKCPGKEVFSGINIHRRKEMSRKSPQNVEEISPSSKTSSFYPRNVEEMTTQRKMSRKTPQNVEEISPSSKTSSFHPRNVEEITAQRKMSRKPPQNVEKISPSSKTSLFHPRNVEEITAQRKMS